jgi:hypothetical protein
MMQPGLPGNAAGVLINVDVTFATVLAATICALPRVPGIR